MRKNARASDFQPPVRLCPRFNAARESAGWLRVVRCGLQGDFVIALAQNLCEGQAGSASAVRATDRKEGGVGEDGGQQAGDGREGRPLYIRLKTVMQK